jgi:predicted kinase
MGRIIILSGPPGAGKTTVAGRLSRGAEASHSLHLHTDDFYGYVRKGFVQPWRPEAHNQNLVLINAMAAAAAICAKGGFEVYVDGVVGPWALDIWLGAARTQDLELSYVVLMPDEATTIGRTVARTGPKAMNDGAIAQRLWQQFQGHALPPDCVLDTTAQAIAETVETVRDGLAAGRFRIA